MPTGTSLLHKLGALNLQQLRQLVNADFEVLILQHSSLAVQFTACKYAMRSTKRQLVA